MNTVIIVDDEPDISEPLSFLFKTEGYKVLTANNGNEAFKLFCDNNADIIVSDIQMKNGDGLQLLENIKNKSIFTPVVLFITGTNYERVAEAYSKGSEAIFSKPFDFEVLKSKVTDLIRSYKNNPFQRHHRENVAYSIEIKLQADSSWTPCFLANIGRGGFFVGLEDKFPLINNVIEYKFRIKADVITGKAVVKWVRKTTDSALHTGFGAEFIHSDENEKLKLFSFVNYFITEQYIPIT